MKKILLSLALLIFILYSLPAQTSYIEFEEYDLKNGLHVILNEDHSTPNVAVTIMYHVGSKNENPDRTGFAHFFEHLMFEGSKNIDRGEYTRIVENSGGVLNANTSYDRTFYYELLPSNQLELGLWLESERMLHLKIDPQGINTQKGVVTEEIKERVENTPYGSLLGETLKLAFNKHPYKWTVLGTKEHINLASDEDIIEFYNTYYVPNNAVLTISGDIDVDITKELISKYFADIPEGKNSIRRDFPKEPPISLERRDTVYDNIQLPAIIQAYHIPAMGTDDYYSVTMLSSLLSSGQSSRFYKTLVDEKQLAIQAQAIPLPLEDPGITLSLVIPNLGVDIKEVESAIDEEIEKTQNEIISEREFQKLRNLFENNLVNSNSTIAGRAENLATAYTYYGDTDRINREIEKFMSVSREDIQRVAKKYFSKNNRVVLYYLPKRNN